jgi:hypothetical protein
LSRASAARPSALVALVAALVTAGSGCARLVTLSPKEVAASNDATWKIRAAPTSASAPSDAPSGAPADAPSPVTPIGAAPIAMRDRPDVRQALGSPPDSLGIPSSLYAADPILTAHRNEMRLEASGRNQAGAGLIVFGLVCGAVSVWALSVGVNGSDAADQSTRDSAAQAAAYGSIGAVLSLTEIIVGTVLLFLSPNSGPLQSYYRETYVDAR